MGYADKFLGATFTILTTTTPLQWLPRNGVATPAQIVNAVQEGGNWYYLQTKHINDLNTYLITVFNMGNDLAVFVTYGAMLVDGNLVTNRLSIGGKTRKTGPNPPKPAIVGGLDTHAVFEGMLWLFSLLITSMTRPADR
jgi:unspecific peroxygenase